MDVPYTLDEATSSNDIMFMERASSQRHRHQHRGRRFPLDCSARAGRTIGSGRAPMSPGRPPAQSIPRSSATPERGNRAVWRRSSASRCQLVNEKGLLDPSSAATPSSCSSRRVNRVTGAQTLTLSDRPELRIDPTAIITTGAIANVSGAQVYSVEAAAHLRAAVLPGRVLLVQRRPASTSPACPISTVPRAATRRRATC